MVHETQAYQTQLEVVYKQVYNLLFGGNIPAVDTGYVKIFEYVKGANITGTASPGETVTLKATILTGQQRTFEYTQTTTADSQGKYVFTVPYSTEGPIAGQTQFDVAPTGPYTITYKDTTKEVRVNEEAVLNGQETYLELVRMPSLDQLQVLLSERLPKPMELLLNQPFAPVPILVPLVFRW